MESEEGKRLQKEKDCLMVETIKYSPQKTCILTTEFLCNIKLEQIKSTKFLIGGHYISVSHLKNILSKTFDIICQNAQNWGHHRTNSSTALTTQCWIIWNIMELQIIYTCTPVLLQTYKYNWNIILMPQIHRPKYHVHLSALKWPYVILHVFFPKSTLEGKEGSEQLSKVYSHTCWISLRK